MGKTDFLEATISHKCSSFILIPLKLYEYKYIETEMFIIDALISLVNDFIYITERLIYQREYSGTLGSSSASFFLSAVWEQAASSAAETK